MADETAALAAPGAAEQATQLRAALGRAADLAEAGGPVVAVLALMSVFALAILIAKLAQFAKARLGERRSGRAALALWQAGRAGDAFARARRGRGPTARVLAIAMEGTALGLSEAKIRERAHAEADAMLETLRSWMRPLEVIASLAPLLGLFGTVLGMIEAFAALEAAGSRVDPAVLSGGIWEALLTTAVGLAVAIPVVVAHNWLERRIEREEHEIDTCLARLFATDWAAAETLAPVPDRQSRGREGRGAHRMPAAAPGE